MPLHFWFSIFLIVNLLTGCLSEPEMVATGQTGTTDPASEEAGGNKKDNEPAGNPVAVTPNSKTNQVFSGTSTTGEVRNNVGITATQDGSADRIAIRGVDECFWGDLGNMGNTPLVKIVHAASPDVVDFVVIFNPNFVDNTYGTTAIGYKRKWKQVHKSDHVELALRDKL